MRKKKIIILDLDQTLIDTKYNTSRIILGDFKTKTNWDVSKRPQLDWFLKYCFKNFDKVIIWSLGTHNYVHEILSFILKPYQKPLYVLTRNNCWISPTKQMYKYTFILQKLFQQKGINYTNTDIIFIDDRPNYIIADEHVDVVSITPYNFNTQSDTMFQQIVNHLENKYTV